MGRSLSNPLSDILFLLWVSTRLTKLKSLSTGALEGVAVLNFMDIVSFMGKRFRISIGDPDFKYLMTSVSEL